MATGSLPAAETQLMAGQRPPSPAVAPNLAKLHLCLLRHLQCVVHLDSEVTDCALQLGVTKQELNGPEVLRLLLQHNRSRTNPIPMAHVADAQAQKIASTQLAVDAEIKQGEFPQSALHLQANPDSQISLSLNGAF